MSKANYKVLFYLLSIVVLASCTKPNQYAARERFIVTSTNLNIRIDPTQLSRPIGTLSKGDTIVALAADKYWVLVKVGDQTGFVSSEYLKKLKPMEAPKFISFVERNANWKTWSFWPIAIFLIALWVISELWLMRYENNLKRRFNVHAKNISISPLVFFAAGIITAVLYLYWKDEVIEALFYHFSIIPRGMGNIAWIIWIQYVTILIGLIVDFIGSIYRSGIKYGHVTFLMELGINIIILITSFFLTLSLFVLAIVILILLFAVLYTIIVTENSKTFSGFLSGK
jgi:hypothetical protein